jgi:uncharacterized membrane protein (UPF0127 family)
MTVYRAVRNAATGAVIIARAKWCASFFCHFRGLMLRPSIEPDEGLLFVYGHESVSLTAIHMLFMNFPIATVWLNGQRVVVDQTLARPWRLAYAPKAPAQYIIEAHPSLLDHVKLGDQLTWDG